MSQESSHVLPSGPLMLELIPSSAWKQNLRMALPAQEWDEVRRWVYRRSGFRCQICGTKGGEHPVECHEQWRYDLPKRVNQKDRRGVQVLKGLQALCPLCHAVRHFGNPQVERQVKLMHLMKVNGWTNVVDVERYIKEQFDHYHYLSTFDWDLEYESYLGYWRNHLQEISVPSAKDWLLVLGKQGV